MARLNMNTIRPRNVLNLVTSLLTQPNHDNFVSLDEYMTEWNKWHNRADLVSSLGIGALALCLGIIAVNCM